MFCSPFNSVRLYFHKRVAILFEPGDADVIMADIIRGEGEATHVEEPASLDTGRRVVGEDHRSKRCLNINLWLTYMYKSVRTCMHMEMMCTASVHNTCSVIYTCDKLNRNLPEEKTSTCMYHYSMHTRNHLPNTLQLHVHVCSPMQWIPSAWTTPFGQTQCGSGSESQACSQLVSAHVEPAKCGVHLQNQRPFRLFSDFNM